MREREREREISEQRPRSLKNELHFCLYCKYCVNTTHIKQLYSKRHRPWITYEKKAQRG
ncbi:unnamed protein product [Ixodes persulcatus]